MYLEIDEGFLEHPKTLQLCSLLQNPLAFGYMMHFWKWATRCCKSGDLRGMSVYAIEEAARYPQHDGKLYAAMVAKLGDRPGFIDADDKGPVGIHNWMIRTGKSISRMERKAEENRGRREAAKARHEAEKAQSSDGIVPESYQNRTGTNPSQTRPDQTRQDKGDPRARARSNGDAKIRPRTAHDLHTCLRVAVEREQPSLGFWNPGGSFAHKEAQDFLAGFPDVEAALDEIEKRIEIFAKDPNMTPWTVARFAKAYNGLGQPKRADGKPAPKPMAVVG